MKNLLAILLSVSLLTGCGNATENSSSPQAEAQTAVGTNGQLISIQSDNVQSAGYDANSMTMTVQFNNGYTTTTATIFHFLFTFITLNK